MNLNRGTIWKTESEYEIVLECITEYIVYYYVAIKQSLDYHALNTQHLEWFKEPNHYFVTSIFEGEI